MKTPRDRTTTALPANAVRSAMGRVLTLPSCRIVCVTGPDEGREWIVDLPVVTIGRGAEAAVALADASVSRIHAVLKLTSRGWQLADNRATASP